MAAVLGAYLTWAAGWVVVGIGLAAIAAAIAYTGGPFPFGYYGLGDLVVFIFFGPVAVCGTYYVQARQVPMLTWWAFAPMGLLITAILVVNNLRDIDGDRASGKMTLAVRLGRRGTRYEYFFCLLGAYLVAVLMISLGLGTPWLLLAAFSLPAAYRLTLQVWRLEGRALNQVLAGTGQLVLLYGLLFALGLILPVLS